MTNANLPAAETAAAVNGGIPATTVRRSDTIAKLTAALTKAACELKNPPKDSVNPFFNCRYADLATVRDAVLPVLARHDLAVLQLPCELDNAAALTTLLMHVSGEWVETTIKLRAVRNDPQGVGSALTYARRYALQAIAGVAAEDDDDGNTAGQRSKNEADRNGRAVESNGRASKPVAPALAGDYSQRLAACRTQAEYSSLCREIKSAVDTKRLTNGDRDTLLSLARVTATRFPGAVAINGTPDANGARKAE